LYHDLKDVSLSPDGQTIYGYYFYSINNYYRERVYAWDLIAGDQLHAYSDSRPHSVTEAHVETLPEGELLLITEDYVKVLTPTFYGKVLPLVFKEYCTAFRDDFSDPASGWPTGSSTTTNISYTNGEYRMHHLRENRWSGVTRGDIWNAAQYAEIQGYLKNGRDGLWGFVFGLNGNWSNFYTFEVIPHQQRWVILHFTAAQGWRLIAEGVSGAIQPGSGLNTLRIEEYSSGTMSFVINGTRVRSLGGINGRIGLSGGSFVENVEIAYDNYIFLDQYCTDSSAAFVIQGQDRFVTNRPPLADIKAEGP